MKNLLRRFVANDSGILLLYYKFKAVLACIIYRFPARELKVIGVTGTDGKTTTVNLVADVLEKAGFKVGFASTLRYKIGDHVWSNRDKMTTQSPFVVQKLLRKMVKAKCDYAVVEVTSHAVVQSRVWGINFDVGVITNMGEDHLEYHKSFENYMRAKGKFIGSLFGMKRKKNVQKAIVLNSDDAHFEYFDQFQGDLKFTYGINSGSVRASNLVLSANNSSFDLIVPNAVQKIETNLIGEFNVYNCLAVISMAISQGIGLAQIAEIMKKVTPIGGRLETVNVGQDFTVVVDYAHTADALEKVCSIFKGISVGRLILVFGATGGGRDKSKRPLMGKVADKYADIIILTDDDPYFEDRTTIIEQIATGIERQEGDRLFKIVDREAAVSFALIEAKAGDVVLITGKGGEEVIVIGDEKIPYDDREVVRRLLSDKIYNQVSLD